MLQSVGLQGVGHSLGLNNSSNNTRQIGRTIALCPHFEYQCHPCTEQEEMDISPSSSS